MKSFPVPALTRNNIVGRILLVLRIFDALGTTEAVVDGLLLRGEKVTKNPLYHALRIIKCYMYLYINKYDNMTYMMIIALHSF